MLVACLFAGLCFAELASMIPIAGSTYTYAYAILGEIFAWIIGWDLILEYAVANMSVAVGFSAYLQDLGDNLFGIPSPGGDRVSDVRRRRVAGGIYNLPALLITMAVTWMLVRGVRESAEANTIMVIIKIAAILIFSFGAARASTPPTGIPSRPTDLRASSPARASCFSPTSASTRSRPRPKNAAVRSAICRSASSRR